MKTEAQAKFDRVIKEGFHDILKPLGFKKKASNFYLQLDGIGQIINIQKSMYGSKEQITFTINAGIFISIYWQALFYNEGKPVPTFPTESECVIRERIGILRSGRDTWYDIDNSTDTKAIISEMHVNLQQHILPYFQSLNTLENCLVIFENSKLHLPPLCRLIIYGELGKMDKARSEYEKILADNPNPNYFETVNEYAKKYNLS